jgi:hypothetical protein
MTATTQPPAVLLELLRRTGERTDTDLPSLNHEEEPWEGRMQSTCDCLSWRGALDNLERRHAEDQLGETVYSRFPVPSRSAVVVAHTLMERGVFTESELQAKISQVRTRIEEPEGDPELPHSHLHGGDCAT